MVVPAHGLGLSGTATGKAFPSLNIRMWVILEDFGRDSISKMAQMCRILARASPRYPK